MGAYQDILGMKHNLFGKPTQVNITFDNQNNVELKSVIESENILKIFKDLNYNEKDILNNLLKQTNSTMLKEKLENYLNDNSYLKTLSIFLVFPKYIKTVCLTFPSTNLFSTI